MKLGALFPQTELAGDPDALREFATAAEDLGYDHLVIYDHPAGASHEGREDPLGGPYTEKDPFWDPFTAIAFLAGMTKRIEFLVGVLVLPQRQTVLVAQQAADVDLMSKGRLRLGVGVGWNRIEYHALGMDFSRRGRRLTEQIPYLRRLWSEELIDFEGEFDQIDRANIAPRPERQIPILCGGFSEPMFRRAVRLADGFVFGYGLTEDAAGALARVEEMLIEDGRPLEGFERQFLLHPPPGVTYSDRDLIDGLRRLAEAGATHAAVSTMDRGFVEVSQHIEYLAQASQALA